MGEAVALKALHAPAFVVNADQHVRAQAFDLAAQVGELPAVFPVAAKQHNAAGERVLEPFAVGFGKSQTGNVDDEGGVLGHKCF